VRQYLLVFASALVILLVVGVAIPNAWARYGGDGFLAASLPVLIALRYVLWPLLAVEHVADGLVRRIAGVPKVSEDAAHADQIEKEILGAISEGEATGAVHEEDADMIASVMEFRNKDVSEIMTPRTGMIALPSSTTLHEAKEIIVREGHSRIPVYGENIDDILGVLYAKDLLVCDEHEPLNPAEIMRKVPFVPETKRISDLLAELREKKVHLAIVLDEYGGTAGLVTIEDIIEEIVGEIRDEYEAAEPETIRRIDDHTVEVDGRVHIDELNEELGTDLPEDRDYDTVGGFIFSEMGKIPATGEEWQYHNIRLRVLDAEARKINRLRIEVLPEEKSAWGEPAGRG
jgi:CBS domain containing-hemolysin-like protein